MDDSQLRIALDAYRRVVGICGSQAATERKIGIKQQTVSFHLKNGHPMPAQYVRKAEEETSVSRSLLRPDLWPIEESPLPEGRSGEVPAGVAPIPLSPAGTEQSSESTRA